MIVIVTDNVLHYYIIIIIVMMMIIIIIIISDNGWNFLNISTVRVFLALKHSVKATHVTGRGGQ
jgi:hypothetical protein